MGHPEESFFNDEAGEGNDFLNGVCTQVIKLEDIFHRVSVLCSPNGLFPMTVFKILNLFRGLEFVAVLLNHCFQDIFAGCEGIAGGGAGLESTIFGMGGSKFESGVHLEALSGLETRPENVGVRPEVFGVFKSFDRQILQIHILNHRPLILDIGLNQERSRGFLHLNQLFHTNRAQMEALRQHIGMENAGGVDKLGGLPRR